jgi:cytochrome c
MLIAGTDCSGCHQRDVRAIGPSHAMLAGRYRPEPATLDALAAKVRTGGSGVWGDVAMPPHPTLPLQDIKTILRYMLSATDAGEPGLPLEGTITPVRAGDEGRGQVVLRATYTDRGAAGLPAQTSAAVKVLRSMQLVPAGADVLEHATFGSRSSGGGARTRETAVTVLDGGQIGYRQVDLTGLQGIAIAATTAGDMKAAGGTVEVRLDSPSGELLGRAELGVAPPAPRGRGAGRAGQAAPPVTQAPAVLRGAGRGSSDTAITLRPATGIHDLYLVFKNPAAANGQPLMTVTAIRVN